MKETAYLQMRLDFHFRWIFFVKLSFVFAFVFFLTCQNLHAEEEETFLADTIDICLNLPSSPDAVDANFAKIGWQKKQGKEAEKLASNILYSLLFTIRHRSENLAYTYKNSAFMTG